MYPQFKFFVYVDCVVYLQKAISSQSQMPLLIAQNKSRFKKGDQKNPPKNKNQPNKNRAENYEVKLNSLLAENATVALHTPIFGVRVGGAHRCPRSPQPRWAGRRWRRLFRPAPRRRKTPINHPKDLETRLEAGSFLATDLGLAC